MVTADDGGGRVTADPRAPYRSRYRGNGCRITIYWPLAIAEVTVAIVVALLLPDLESHFHWTDGLDYDASTAQTTLAAIAGGMITLTGFVLTAVTLMVQTVQDQSSRLLQVLNRTDRSPLLFGTFAATFTYALLVLSEVHGDDVPTISVTIALVLVLICTVLFLRLLVTFRNTLTVGGLTRNVGGELRRLIGVIYPAPFADGAPEPAPDQDGPPAWVFRHTGEPGVFQSFSERAAVRLAARTGTQIRFVPAVGDFVVTGAPLAYGYGAVPQARAFYRLIRVGPARTLEQDPAYGIRMLVDIAIRALSPAVNDPTSAVQALDQIDDVLHRLAARSLGDGLLHDQAGRVVVRYPAPTWDTFLALAVDEILLYGGGSLQVTRRVRAMLEDLLADTHQARWPAISAKLAALQRATQRAFPDKAEESEAAEPDRQGIGSPRKPLPGDFTLGRLAGRGKTRVPPRELSVTTGRDRAMSSMHDQEAAAEAGRQYVPRPAAGGYETEYTPVGSRPVAAPGGGSVATMGFTVLAAVIMLLSGLASFFEGLAAIVKGNFFVTLPNYAYNVSVSGWGWIHLIMGIVVFLAGACLFMDMLWARIVGVTLASFSLIMNLLYIPYFPVWSIIVIALDLFVIWALLAPRRQYV